MWNCPKCGEQLEDQFDSCWQCAGKPAPTHSAARRLTWRFFILAALMAIRAPALADSLHTLAVVADGTRFYNAELGRLAYPGYWIFIGIRAVITFLALWFFRRTGVRDVFTWGVCAGLWILLDLQLEIAIK